MSNAVAASFMSLLETHEGIDELFLQHQEALISIDIAGAVELLDVFERELLAHMRHEEERLFPVYERAGEIQGGALMLFLAEHRKMREMLAQFREMLAGIDPSSPGAKRAVLRLLDTETAFKSLMAHHDLREGNILYPTLDRVTSIDERRRLLEENHD